MSFTARNKLSPPPPAQRTDADRAALLSVVHHPGYEVIIDELHRAAVQLEIEVYHGVGDYLSDEQTLARVRQAQAAWILLDRVQMAVQEALQEREDRTHEAADELPKVMNLSTQDILSIG